eukprot:GSChrysophyteH1.ASY1.ANO1.2171.1 assembled CDS
MSEKVFSVKSVKKIKIKPEDTVKVVKKSSRQSPFENEFFQEMQRVKKQLPIWKTLFSASTNVEHRMLAWDELDRIWNPIRDKFAWAIPDNRALRILKSFSPLVEIGAGKGYWASLLQKQGVDILPFDIRGSGEGPQEVKYWTEVKTGGPEMLKRYVNRALFLCYPDEDESIAIQCLENYAGEYIIHVGELFAGDGTQGGVPQAPFGRTTSGTFQQELSIQFHPLLIADLKARLPYSRDTISVWKRTVYVPGRLPTRNSKEDEEDEDEGEEMEEDGEEEEEEDSIGDGSVSEAESGSTGSYADFNSQYFADFYEHEKMLADNARMNFYHSVINDTIKAGDIVIDIGTGTGILAAFASRAGAAYTYAIDHNENVVTCAEELALRNEIKNVEFVIGHSRERSKVDVLLHEQMGDCLFDEDMVTNVVDLRDRLLKPGGIIAPSCYDLYIEPVQLDAIRMVPFIGSMNDVQGYDFSCLNEPELREKYQVDTNPGYHHLRSSDPSLIDKYLSQLKPVLSVDLHTITEESLPMHIEQEKLMDTSGSFDGYAVFFRCRFNGRVLDTSPHASSRACHWGYRILRCDGRKVQKGELWRLRIDVGRWADLNSWSWDQKKSFDKRAWNPPRRMMEADKGKENSEEELPDRGRQTFGHQQASREAELDRQYAEPEEKKWAAIPSSERIPCDRAAPCLAHLLM